MNFSWKLSGFKVAIKIIKKEMLILKPSMQKKLEREIAVLRLLNHPNVLRLYDVFETSRYLYLFYFSVCDHYQILGS